LGLGFLLPVAAIVTTVILVMMTDAHPGAKAAAVFFCIGTFLLPRFISSLWWSAGPLQLVLSIVIILYLKFQRYVS
jgi:hypothetical protein